MKNPNFRETIRKIPLYDRDEDKVLDENDTDKEESISVRENDSQSERVQQAIQKDDKHRDGAEIEALLGLPYLSGVWYRIRVNIEELWRMGLV
ncbi:hypothetical protein NPIL_371381 [Nephila pilipes]|uniref:Uncharacterized protein n=1 Tax=Nephila pilipes TaxID=299642 RepID=A0A8X6PED9_NEPPI|nr:hypothetical protein NPIL_371381 [Nephila pilipes]